MGIFNAAITRIFDFIFAPSALSPWLGMVLISLLTGFVLLLYGYALYLLSVGYGIRR